MIALYVLYRQAVSFVLPANCGTCIMQNTSSRCQNAQFSNLALVGIRIVLIQYNYAFVIMMHACSPGDTTCRGSFYASRHPSGVYQRRKVGMMHEYSTGNTALANPRSMDYDRMVQRA